MRKYILLIIVILAMSACAPVSIKPDPALKIIWIAENTHTMAVE